MADETPVLPAHVESTVQAIARLHAEHYERATPLQRVVDRLIAAAGRPWFVAVLTVAVVGWVAVNLTLSAQHRTPLDPPPFYWLQGLSTLGALYMTVMILSTQSREDELARHREQLTLELAILSEQKSAKIIQLLEELRRDSPIVADRHDAEAEALSAPSDPQAVLDAIKQSRGERAPPPSRCSVPR